MLDVTGRFVCPRVAAPGRAPEVSGDTQTGYFLLNTQKVGIEKGSGGLGEQMWVQGVLPWPLF